ncbi:hypothetical protein PsorP6_000410 [Peronosclerospora sorghi]|uniref:Uncharacterized protein n=1 Tax=Peronosclerospora sorghi TaxID=230839 RepID=A0ACC0WQK8_9STRA|nr:hypothetical protein PsorP6_000410 [Peronosclerospora sorghi]
MMSSEQPTTTKKGRGGRPADSVYNNFKKTSEMKNQTFCLVSCNYCEQAHNEDPDNVPKKPLVPGRKDALVAHITRCHYYNLVKEAIIAAVSGGDENTLPTNTTTTSDAAASRSTSSTQYGLNRQARTEQDSGVSSSSSSSFSQNRNSAFQADFKRQHTMDTFTIQPWSDAKIAKRPSARGHYEYQSSFSMDRTACCEKVVRILESYGSQVLPRSQDIESQKQELTEATTAPRCASQSCVRLLGEQCSQSHIGSRAQSLRSTMDLRGNRMHDLSGLLLELFTEGWNVGAVITDNAGQCARARRILARRWPSIVFLLCFTHQVNLLVKDVLSRIFGSVAEQATAMINTLSHSTS